MPTITSVVKSEGHLIITYSDGVVVQRSIVYADTMVSEPPEGYEEIGNCYVNAAGNLIVNYNGSSIEIQTDDLTGAEVVALLEALASGNKLSHNDGLSDLTTGNPHTQYADKILAYLGV